MATAELRGEGQGTTKVVERSGEPTQEDVAIDEWSTEPAKGLEQDEPLHKQISIFVSSFCF